MPTSLTLLMLSYLTLLTGTTLFCLLRHRGVFHVDEKILHRVEKK